MTFASAQTPPARRDLTAVTLLELLISVSLTMLIILALYQMFARTQKAMHGSIVAGDLTENARSAMDLLRRELETISPGATPLLSPRPFTPPVIANCDWSQSSAYPLGTYVFYVGNFYISIAAVPPNRPPPQNPALWAWVPGVANLHVDTATFSTRAISFAGSTGALDDICFLSFDPTPARSPAHWTVIGYRVASPTNAFMVTTNGVGTLYRFQTVHHSPARAMTNYNIPFPPGATNLGMGFYLYPPFNPPAEFPYLMSLSNSFARIADGVVYFKARVLTNGIQVGGIGVTNFVLTGTNLPSAVQLEVGFLEAPVYGAAAGLPVNLVSNYLSAKAAHVHLFQTLIPVRATPQ